MDPWDRISANADRVPVRPGHLELAAERLVENRANPGDGEPAIEALERIRRQYW